MKAVIFILLASIIAVSAFQVSTSGVRKCVVLAPITSRCPVPTGLLRKPVSLQRPTLVLQQASISESDQTVLGAVGTLAAVVTLISEFKLKTTGCGLPAGPFGLIGLVEGISYLVIIGLAGYSLFTKVKTGSGLPAGPGGILGAAEGLSFLAIVVGLVVVAFQITDYGFIPEAVPTEGGICS